MRPLLACLIFLVPAWSAGPLFDGSSGSAANVWSAVRGNSAPDSAVSHAGQKSMRVEGDGIADAIVRSTPVSLTIGKRYELSGWLRTENLEVRDVDRSPISTGAAIAMASMPRDVHSESLGATRDWTRVHLRFTATRAQDNILLTAGNGGAFKGKAWFAGVNIDEASAQDEWPSKAAVATFGPAYRYPSAGWIYLHIEGKPFDRGYQHGRLMSKEIVQYLERCAADIDNIGKEKSWDAARTYANALFLRGFDAEILEEMKGIAAGASDAGATWLGRKIDLIDIVAANTTVELGELRSAMPMTPTGLEGLHLQSPAYAARDVSIFERCSAFAATGRATKDGKMVIAHLTMWPLTLAEQTNVMLDIKPAAGHRVLMQSYPGGIESGTDWYQNDAGMVLTETTIRQSPFNIEGTPVAYRARKAIQYGDNIDKVVEYLSTKNNGLYTNEWLIGDAKNNEIAMFELSTYKPKLWRSSKNEWFGGTEGFYWGCNNAKDLAVRLEYQPDPQGAPVHVPYVPAVRDVKWQELYAKYKGQIDEQFAFLAMRTAPLVSSTAMDAKVVTSDLASHLMVWANFGKPNEREWVPSARQLAGYAKNDGLYPSGYRLFSAEPSTSLQALIASNEQARLNTKPAAKVAEKKAPDYKERLWKGWLLPASDADTWLTAGSAAYYEDLQAKDLDNAMGARWAGYRAARLAGQNFALETNKGAIFFDKLRRDIGDDGFFKLMTDYFSANTTKTVTGESFLAAAKVKFELPPDKGGPLYVASDIARRLSSAVLVYGTLADAGANRYAAEQLQKQFLDIFESAVPIRKDFEVTAEDLRSRDVIFVGRPEANSALAAWGEKLGLDYKDGDFRVAGKNHASEKEAMLWAAANPSDQKHMVLMVAGNSALETVRLARSFQGRHEARTAYAVFESGTETSSGFNQ